MLYCTKCRSLCEETSQKCPHCKNTRFLRPAAEEDFVLLKRADLYTAQRLAEVFSAGGVEYQLEEFQKGRVSHFYDSEVMPTDQNVFVKYGQLSTASNLCAQAEQAIQKERWSGEEGFEDMPSKKRFVVQSVSVVLFLLLIILVVLGADFLSNWLKEIFANF